MSDITFFYIPDIYQDKMTGETIEIFRPKIPIRLSINHKVSRVLIDCLFDTGSDRNLFPADWGRSLGLKVEKGKMVKIGGIGKKNEITAYSHPVVLYVGIHKIATEADFSDEQNMPLLGRVGFMDRVDETIVNEKKRSIRIIF